MTSNLESSEKFEQGLRFLENGAVWKSAQCFEEFDGAFAPPNRKYWDIDRYREYVNQVRNRQSRDDASKLPCFLLTSLPQSASGFLTRAISEIYDVPIVNVAVGSLFLTKFDVVVRRWLLSALDGGISTHTHFSASPRNLSTLLGAGVKRLVVQTRDPRQAVYSNFCKAWERLDKYPEWHANQRWRGVARDEALRFAYHDNFLLWCKWLMDWVEASETVEFIDIAFVDFEDVRSRPAECVRSIAEHFSVPSHDAERIESYFSAVPVHRNFRSGRDDEWLSDLPDDLIRWIKSGFPSRLAERFDWKV